MKTPDCPLCPENGLLKEPVIAQTDAAYLIRALSSPGNFLIVPKIHTENPADLPADWWVAFAELLGKIPGLGKSYNISLNFGQPAGQTVAHVHFWVIPRAGGQAASGKGLARLIAEADRQ